MYQSTITSWALLLAKAIDHSGHSSGAVFRQVGLDIEKLRDPNARYSYKGMTRLWRKASEITGDPCIGIKAAGYWHPTTLHALGYSWMASSSLQEALERTIKYLHIVSTASELHLQQKHDLVDLFFSDNDKAIPAIEAVDAGLAVIVDMCRTSYGEDFRVEHVYMKRVKPLCSDEFVNFFRAPISFSSERNAICFYAEDLKKELSTANRDLVRVNDQIISEYLSELEKDNIVGRVKVEIIRQLASGDLTEEWVAKHLNTSLRSLQRKLTRDGTSYQALLDITRQGLAIQYISNSRYSINEITFLLGFSEPSNFSRAFKRWTGQSPSAFRSGL